ncbi:MAG: hypothetical protein RR704_00665 [Stenotrophomonas sp.]
MSNIESRRHLHLRQVCFKTKITQELGEYEVLRLVDCLFHGRAYQKGGFQSYIQLPDSGKSYILGPYPLEMCHVDGKEQGL